jgi:ribosomal protein S18 acetylase RimI-like enzyme
VAAEGESARRAVVGDAVDVTTLAADYLVALTGARGGEALAPRVRPLADVGVVESLVASSPGLIVGLYEGVVAGFAHAIVREDSEEDRRVEVEAMYIDPQFRRVGVGEAMIGEVARFASEVDTSTIDVVTLPGDGATKSFLEATGFRARQLVMRRSTSRT